ncbi:uncharacterized protein spz6 [Neodiprion pinetum]|uniref:Uncharacterized protein LOC107219078 n=1 Tax=Neodiprion lecontei TaxID=441921 RepID=A0A6J0BFX9_NEOLC|nr:uncharacterized protein LOC107219078 [Neodiprion lecontei]XP_046433110.1 uncharacterized protein LOC124185928 [Neodiprion fabricii]XP_046489744.1 uncharacterized protein LOC124222623 [Neodiprion pinetum]XP_046629477.1 uncharacterized protein LOC124309667 [Neodiprion virginianus]
MNFRTFILVLICASAEGQDFSKPNFDRSKNEDAVQESEPPEGYYAFVESPNAEPPKVRPPPYMDSDKECQDPGKQGKGFVSVHNICGDLNKGYIPRNPMRQNVLGSSYPFELLRNHTLKFLSKALPILKADNSLPKVAKIEPFSQNSVDTDEKRSITKRSATNTDAAGRAASETEPVAAEKDATRTGRKFCESGGGVVCMLYKAIQGEPLASAAAERRDDPPTPEYRQRTPPQEAPAEYSGPPTPCPAKVEYATPVFAKNYQGVWRYVVQIPYEGYFTQTIEITRCMQTRCHYLDGGCLSSPRWTSLLVAEIFYPDTFLEENQNARLPGPREPVAGSPPPVHDFQNYQQYLQKRAGESEARSNSGSQFQQQQQQHCDGVDDMGCFQVRLYYDWFLVPGSCKCWRPDYFNRYVRRGSSSPDL